jgi:hypothetical protein
VRRVNVVAVAAAAQLLAHPLQVWQYPPERQEFVLQSARHLVARYGHLINASKHPAELDRMARQRRRARQTHPGKRGRV